MTPTRRAVTFGLALMALKACGTGMSGSAPPAVSRDPDLIPTRTPGWSSWVAGFRPRAEAAGLDAGTIDRAFSEAGYMPGVIERDRNQAEFSRTLEDYLQITASEEKVANGRAAFARQRDTLAAIEAQYGVPAETVAAIWGVESNFGERRGDIPLVSALSTLAYEGRRGAFFEQQLIAALRILQSGDTAPETLVGSWAGAMGHTQFIPTSYQAHAVDFTGDGRRDIWSSNPADALASAANYLAQAGWRSGEPWGYEITPARQGSGGRVIQPQPGGPSFRVFHNFDVIQRYNNSVSYAVGVGHLSDRIAGGGPIQGRFPPDQYGLTLAQRQDLQRRLTRAGYDAGSPDGVIGSGTEDAITGYQSANGLAVTGNPSVSFLQRLGG